MNLHIIRYILGWVLKIEAFFMMLPCIVALLYQEKNGYAYLFTAFLCILLGILCSYKKPKNMVFYAKEGFLITVLSWISLSIMGAIPFLLTKEISSPIDALFEIISGFTTTGASILNDVEVLSHASLFWRSFSHWIGGMGVLVFILAILPMTGGQNMHLMKAESPGPSVGKLVPRLRTTALILYSIYLGMTVLEFILLILGGMPVFDAITVSFGTAGTGGFAIKNASLAAYPSYFIQGTVTIFMFLFGINFNAYYLILIKKPKEAFKMEEVRWYFIIALFSILAITINISKGFSSFWQALHHAAFQVTTIMSTTGFATIDFDKWPEFSRTILVLLMFFGACAGSTAGGIKISRIIILVKTIAKELSQMIHPRSIKTLKLNGKKLPHEILRSVNTFLMAYIVIFIISILCISLDNFDLITNFTAVAATINNIGPGLSIVGPSGNFSSFSDFSKIVLIFDMLAGRLEIFPLLLFIIPKTWKSS